MTLEIDCHVHTVASGHAYSTLLENVTYGKKNGLKLIGITDHGPAMPGSPHIYHFNNLRSVPRFINDIGILRGIEANIVDYHGRLDIDTELYQKLDLVIASLHEPVLAPTNKSDHTSAIVKTLSNGLVDILGHGGNPQFPLETKEVVQAAIAYNTLIEVNNSSFTTSRPGSKKQCIALLEAAALHDGQVIFGSDAHICTNVGVFDKCLELIDEIGFPKSLIINYSTKNFIKFLIQKGKKHLAIFT